MSARRPGRGIVTLLVLLLGLGVLPFAGFVPGPLATDSGLVVTGIRARAPSHVRLSQQVYGYLPYWQLNGSTAKRLRYDLLSTIALFGMGITAKGDVDTTTPGYQAYLSRNAIDVINAAHDRGVRVVPTFQLFDFGSLRTLRAFLARPAAQQRFIKEAVRLIVSRKADGANLDFEPLPDSMAGDFAAFTARFHKALLKAVPDATLVVALGAGASGTTIDALAPHVDQLFIMAYDYRTARSSSAGPVAPLDARWLSVRSDLARYLRHAPPGKVILGMPVYGYDWPVQDRRPGAPVRDDAHKVGRAFAVDYSAITRFLEQHPGLDVQYDARAGAPYFTYHDHDTGTYRQVWFEDARSLGSKIDLALTSKLAGVGLWALDDAPEFAGVWTLLDSKLREVTHRVVVKGSLFHLRQQNGQVWGDITASVQNRGSVPETGRLGWAVLDPRDRVVASGSIRVTVDSLGARTPLFAVRLGTSAGLAAGTYEISLVFRAGGRHWSAPVRTFKQRY
jgi:spore germination protein YaaH